MTTANYESNATLAQIAQRIGSAKRVAVLSHSKPDGDSLGSMLAITRALTGRGQSAEMFLMGPVEANLLLLVGDTPYRMIELMPDNEPDDDFDLVIVVDTGAWSQLEPVGNWLRRHHERTVGIDHHSHGDDVASLRFVDPAKASTTQIIVSLLDEMGVELTGGINGVAEPLFLGLATDTGWFRHANAGAEVFAVAARLLACGVDKTRLYQIIEESHRPQRLDLEARALSSITYARDGSVAIMSLGLEDFEETGGTVEDLTGMVNLPLTVGTVRVSILLAQHEPHRTKASFRSKPPLVPLPEGEVDASVDMNELAQRFGGGGHIHAAGARLAMDVAEARKAVLKAVEA